MRRRPGTRVLAAVLFTDIVDSAKVSGQVGDARWRELIARHHAIVRRELKRFGGREIDTAGDGFFASFTEPAPAIRCACAATDSVRQLGIEIRTGVHFGECEQLGAKLAGLTVVVGARVMALGGPGDVLVTSTARELVGGAGFGFQDRGTQALKGIEGEWRVLAVTSVDGAVRSGPAKPREAERRLSQIQPIVPRQRTRRLLIGALLAPIVVATAFIALRASQEVSPGLARIPVNSVGRLDPGTNTIEDTTLRVGSEPTGIAVGDGVVWITSLEAGTLSRVDLDGRDMKTLSTGGHPAAISLDENGWVWVLNGFEGSVVRVDPRRMVIDKRIPLGTGTNDLAAGSGAIWVTNGDDRTLTRIDLITSDISAVSLARSIGRPKGVAVDPAAVWVGGSRGVAKVDPNSLKLMDSWSLRFPAGRIASGEGSVWTAHPADDQVTKIDEVTGPSEVIPVGNGPLDLTTGGGAIWVTNSLDGTVSRIDPDTNNVAEIRVGSSPEGIAFGNGSVWVAVHTR